MGVKRLRKVYDRYNLTDVIEEEVRLINLGVESSLKVIINELCNRSVERHIGSNLYISQVEVECNPLLILVTLEGTSEIDPEKQKALEAERSERAALVSKLVSFMGREIVDKIIENGYTPEDIARDYYVRKLGSIGSKLLDEDDDVVPFTGEPSLDFYKSITIDFENSTVTAIEF